MNFLGHCLFSEQTPDALTGSLWPDFGKKPQEIMPVEFFSHFDRHQVIDKVTDKSDVLEPLRAALRPRFRKTTPIVVDMLLDHHLAKHWGNYHSDSLEQFSSKTYVQLHAFESTDSPENLVRTLHWMRLQNWFVSYRSTNGIQRAMSGISKRIRFKNPLADHGSFATDQSVIFKQDIDSFLVELTAHINSSSS